MILIFVLFNFLFCQNMFASDRENDSSNDSFNIQEAFFEVTILSDYSLFLKSVDMAEGYLIRLQKPLSENDKSNVLANQFTIIGSTKKIGLISSKLNVIISVNGYQNVQLEKQINSSLHLVVDGISYIKGQSFVESTMKYNPYSPSAIEGERVEGSAVSCGSGGPGSTSCSVKAEIMGIAQECSVTCGAGYYACCSPMQGTCKCVKN